MLCTHFWMFIVRTRKWTLLFAAMFVIGSILLLFLFPVKAKTITQQWDNMQLWLSTLTLFVACAVWLSEAQQEWGGDLPKRLSVDFKLVTNEQEDGNQAGSNKERIVMRCKRAKLIGEGDIRALAQQIGRQMVNNQDLKMIPMLDEVSDKIDHRRKEKHYQVTVRLTSMPECLVEIPEDKIVLWEDDFTVPPQPKPLTNENC